MSDAAAGTLILGLEDVSDLLDMEKAIDLTRDVLREQGRGEVVANAPMHIDVPKGSLRIVSGALVGRGRMGLRANAAQALTSSSGALMLFDSETGALLCVMAYPYGTMRTRAMYGVVSDVLSKPSAKTVAMIGTGRNALGLIQAAQSVRAIEQVNVFSRDEARRAEFAQKVEDETGLSARACATVEEATQDADIVLVSTNARRPAVHAHQLKPGTLVAGMGTPSEFDESVYLEAENVIVSSIEHEKNFDLVWRDGSVSSTLVDLDASARLPWGSVLELGPLVDAENPLTLDGSWTVFRESAGGYGDIAFASYIYEQALAKDRGFRMRFR